MIFYPSAYFHLINVNATLFLVMILSLVGVVVLHFFGGRSGRSKSVGKIIRNLKVALGVIAVSIFILLAYILFSMQTYPTIISEQGNISVDLTSQVKDIANASFVRTEYQKYDFYKWFSNPRFYSEEQKLVPIRMSDHESLIIGGNLSAKVSNFQFEISNNSQQANIANIKYGWIDGDNAGIKYFGLISNSFTDLTSVKSYLLELKKQLGSIGMSFSFSEDMNEDFLHGLSIESYSQMPPMRAVLESDFIYGLSIEFEKRPYSMLIKENTILTERSEDSPEPSYYLKINLNRSSLRICKTGELPIQAKVVDYGTYALNNSSDLHTSETKVENNNVAGGLIMKDDKTIISSTLKVKADIGVNFGFRYTLSRVCLTGDKEFDKRLELPVTIKAKHPKEIYDPKVNKKFSVSEWSQEVPFSTNYKERINYNTGWIFTGKWEMVEGLWTIELYERENKLAEKSFEVYQ